MAHDLFFRKPTKRSWSRDPQATIPGHAEKVEASKVSIQQQKLIALKTAADKGDKKAQKKWAKVSKRVVRLHLKASKGDLKAAKTLAMLTPTGLFVTTVGPKAMKTTMKGSFVGKDEILGAFVGGDSVTEILGDDKLTEIITSGGAFVGDDKLTEIITSGWNPLKLAKKALKTGYKFNPYTGKYSMLSAAKKGLNTANKAANMISASKGDDESGLDEILGKDEVDENKLPWIEVIRQAKETNRQRDLKKIAHDKSLPIDKKISTSLLGDDESGNEEIVTSGKFIGEEEVALAAEGGACERAALRRRSVRKA